MREENNNNNQMNYGMGGNGENPNFNNQFNNYGNMPNQNNTNLGQNGNNYYNQPNFNNGIYNGNTNFSAMPNQQTGNYYVGNDNVNISNIGNNDNGNSKPKRTKIFKGKGMIPIIVGAIIIVIAVIATRGGGKNLVCTYDLVDNNVRLQAESKFVLKENFFNSTNKLIVSKADGGEINPDKVDSAVEQLSSLTSFGGGFNLDYKLVNNQIVITWTGSHYAYSDVKTLKNDMVNNGYTCK